MKKMELRSQEMDDCIKYSISAHLLTNLHAWHICTLASVAKELVCRWYH